FSPQHIRAARSSWDFDRKLFFSPLSSCPFDVTAPNRFCLPRHWRNCFQELMKKRETGLMFRRLPPLQDFPLRTSPSPLGQLGATSPTSLRLKIHSYSRVCF